MAAVNFQMAANVPFDFLPGAHLHSRSNSVSSSSSHSPGSRPQSSQGGGVLRSSAGLPPSAEDLYRASFHTTNSFDHARNTSDASLSSAYSLDLATPADSPPNHNITNPALKGHLRQTHIRARVSASPYPRDTESVHSSSSETEDISMYLAATGPEYHPTMYAAPPPAMMPTPESMHAPAAAYGRMALNPDHALEKLAANVRAATTTSASDRAKQIFVQAWYVPPCFPCSAPLSAHMSLFFLFHSPLCPLAFIPPLAALVPFLQADSKLLPVPRRERPPPGPVLLVPPGLRSVWDPTYQYRHARKGDQAMFPYNQNKTSGGPREQQVSLCVFLSFDHDSASA